MALGLLLAALAGLEVYGLATGHLFSQLIWYPQGLERFRFYLGGFVALALPCLLMAPWSFPGIVALGVVAATALLAGPFAVVAAALFLLSAFVLGARLLRPGKDSLETILCATLAGIGVYVFLMTLAARLPLHYSLVWLVVLALPLALFGSELRRLKVISAPKLRLASERSAFALLVLILGTHWLMALAPEIGADGLAMHLAVPANIAAHHAFTVQPTRLVWSVMPMGADFIYAIVYLLGGEFAARLLNFSLLLMVEGLLYGVLRRCLPQAASFLLLAAFASTPLVQLVTGELFVENLQAAMVLGMLLALWRYQDTGEIRCVYLTAALAGTAMTVKLGSLAFVVCLWPFALWEARRRLPSWIGLFLVTGLPAYFIAWWKTGNPVFPFFNPTTGVVDYRFREPLSLATPYDLVFRSHLFYEGQDGSFGFHFLLLVPLAALAYLVAPRRSAAVVVGFGAALLLLFEVPNARYIYGTLPLLVVASAAALAWLAATRPRLYRVAMVLFAATTALNIWFLPSSSYYHKDFYPPDPSGVRLAARYFHRSHPSESAALLLTSDSDEADLAADAHSNLWHERALYDQIRQTPTTLGMMRVMQRFGIRYFLAPKRSGRLHPRALAELLGGCTSPEYDFDGYTVLRIRPDCLDRPLAERPLEVVHAGVYDDFDPPLRFTGGWDQTEDFDGPYLHSISYSDTAGAIVAMAFEGKGLTYVFTRAPNRGVAEIAVDGVPRATLDLYAPRIQWQSHFDICCLPPGRHVVHIRATGRKQPAASGAFIDLDALEVR